jgi:hypothetical protein
MEGLSWEKKGYHDEAGVRGQGSVAEDVAQEDTREARRVSGISQDAAGQAAKNRRERIAEGDTRAARGVSGISYVT